MDIGPRIGSSRPVQSQEHKRYTADEEDGPNGVACPENVLDGQLGRLCSLRRPVEEEETQRGGTVKCGLHPKDVPPSRCIDIRDSSSPQRANTASEVVSVAAEWTA